MRRATVELIDEAAASASKTVALPVPSWAGVCILHVVATTAASSAYDVKVQQKNPDGSGTAIDVPGVAIDQIGASQTAVHRHVAFGRVRAISGTSYDAVAAPLSKYMQVVATETVTATNVKVWAEFVEVN